jgi:hypothetical protein
LRSHHVDGTATTLAQGDRRHSRSTHRWLPAAILIGAAFVALTPRAAVGQASPCEVKREPFVNGGMAAARMTGQQGGTCQFKFKFGGQNPPDSWQPVEAPKSGSVTFKEDAAEYQPTEGFSGSDRFVIALFGKTPNCGNRCARNGRCDVVVTTGPR